MHLHKTIKKICILLILIPSLLFISHEGYKSVLEPILKQKLISLRRTRNSIPAEPLEELKYKLTLQERYTLSSVATLYEINSGEETSSILVKYPEIAQLLCNYFEAKFLTPQSVEEIEFLLKEEISKIVENKPNDAKKLSNLLELHKSIVDTSVFSPFYKGGPPALLFVGEKFPDSMRKAKLVAFIPDKYGSFGIVIFSEHDDMKWQDINSAGGIRVVLTSTGFNIYKIWKHDEVLAQAMRLKNIWAGIPWAGVKMCLVLAPHITKEDINYPELKRETLKRVLKHAADIGLFTWYVGGPDVNIVAEDIQASVPVIQQRYLDYLELELQLIDLFVSGQINGKNIEDLGEDSSNITLNSGFTFTMDNSTLQEAYYAYQESYGQGEVSSINELANLGRDSNRKTLYLFDENDPAYSHWREIISLIEQSFGLRFPGDENLIFNAMRERVLQQIRDEQTDFDMSIESNLRDDLYRIMGVLVGGGLSEMGTFARAKELDGITGQLTIRGLNRVVEHLRNKGKLPKKGERKLSIIIRGSGDVGTAAALEAIAAGYKVVGISNKYSSIYSTEGFTRKQIQELREATNKDKNISLVFGQGTEGIQFFNNPDSILELEADFPVPCAIGPTVKEDNIETFEHFKAIVAGENYPYQNDEVVEKLHDLEIMATKGWLVNFGMVYAVWVEAFLKHRYTVEELKSPRIWNQTLRDIREDGNAIIDEMLPLVLKLSDQEGRSPNFIAEDIVHDIEDEMVKIYSDTSVKNETKINKIILDLRQQGYKMTYTQARRIAAYELSREKILSEYREKLKR